jgi:hypothetical protein
MEISLATRPDHWSLLVIPHGGYPDLLRAAARLVVQNELTILDGGNRCNLYQLTRTVAGRHELLRRIHISRAFTCYQMLALLEGTSARSASILLLDFLATFQDENVSFIERQRLLEGCLVHIRRLNRLAGVLVSVSQPKVQNQETGLLLTRLQDTADEVWAQPVLPPVPEPMRLF